MRLQVRVGEQFPELLEHLESFRPEYRGRRLLALAAMQLAASGGQEKTNANILVRPADEKNEQLAGEQKQQPTKKRTPEWIKKNASA